MFLGFVIIPVWKKTFRSSTAGEHGNTEDLFQKERSHFSEKSYVFTELKHEHERDHKSSHILVKGLFSLNNFSSV